MQMNVAGLRRNIKNLAHNYSDAQVKVREATSNDPWGPSATIMAEIADLTYNVVAFSEIMQMVWKRLNDHGKNWRHVYKALILLEYLIKTGSEKVAQQCIENIFAVQTLREFVYYEEGKDQGLHVREKAKQLVVLLKDDERLKNERAKALKAKERFAQHPSGFGSDGYVDGPSTAPPGWRDEPPKNPGDVEFVRPQTAGEEELQLQLAMAMSREEAEQEEAKRRSDDVRLQLALSQSEHDFKRPNERKTDDQNKQSHLLDLLDISLGAASLNSPTDGAAGTTDPWGTPNHLTQHAQRPDPWSGATSPQSDPWQAPPRPPISVGATADSWLTQRTHSPAMAVNPLNDTWRQQNSTPTSALNGNLSNPITTDPWLTKSTAIAVASHPPGHDPWLGARATPKNDDPWLAKSTTNLPNADPWTMGSNHLESRPSPLGAITSPLSELDDFDIITNRNKAGLFNTNGANNNNSSFLDDMDPLSLKKTIKSPQSFLGENSSLVNLDNLIKPVVPVSNSATGGAYNPFSDSNLAPAAKPNLFQQQQQTVPSINQLKQQPFPVTLNQDPWAPVNSNNTTTQLDEDDDDDDDDCFFDTNHVVISNSNSQIFGSGNYFSNSNLDITSNSIIDSNNLYNSTNSINQNDNILINSSHCKSPSQNFDLTGLIASNYISECQMNMNNSNNNSNAIINAANNSGLLSFDNINYLDNNNTPWIKPEVAATNPFLS